MADITTDRRSGPAGNSAPVRQHDEGDGTYSESVSSHGRVWDTSGLTWIRHTGDASTGAANVRVVGSTPAASASTGLSFALIDTAASGDTSIVAAVSAKKIKVVSYTIVVASAVNVTWYSGAAGTKLSGAMAISANGGLVECGAPNAHLLETAVNTALVLNLSGAVQASGHLAYFTEA